MYGAWSPLARARPRAASRTRPVGRQRRRSGPAVVGHASMMPPISGRAHRERRPDRAVAEPASPDASGRPRCCPDLASGRCRRRSPSRSCARLSAVARPRPRRRRATAVMSSSAIRRRPAVGARLAQPTTRRAAVRGRRSKTAAGEHRSVGSTSVAELVGRIAGRRGAVGGQASRARLLAAEPDGGPPAIDGRVVRSRRPAGRTDQRGSTPAGGAPRPRTALDRPRRPTRAVEALGHRRERDPDRACSGSNQPAPRPTMKPPARQRGRRRPPAASAGPLVAERRRAGRWPERVEPGTRWARAGRSPSTGSQLGPALPRRVGQVVVHPDRLEDRLLADRGPRPRRASASRRPAARS